MTAAAHPRASAQTAQHVTPATTPATATPATHPAAVQPVATGGEVAPRTWGLVPCGGSGSRAGAGLAKQYRPLAGLPVLGHTLSALAQVPELSGLLLAIAPADAAFGGPHEGLPPTGWAGLPPVRLREAGGPPWLRVHRCAGDSRAQTVLNGLRLWQAELGAADADWVLVHDAARCLVRPAAVSAFIRACWADGVGGLMAIPLPDTLKQAGGGRVATTVPRHDKWLAQTPQMFRLGALRQALEAARPSGFGTITDESSAMEQAGHSPLLVLGSPDNLKLTYPPDFALAHAILKERQP